MKYLKLALVIAIGTGAYLLFGLHGITVVGLILTGVFLLQANSLRLQIKEIEARRNE